MVLSFSEFINESHEAEKDFIQNLTDKLLQKIKEYRESESKDYVTFSGMNFSEPFEFKLILELRRDANFNAKEDPHFNELPWEQLNYEEHGYSIDANTRINAQDLPIPIIKMTLVVNPKQEPHLYTALYARILDILTHETNHLEQGGNEPDPFAEPLTTGKEREQAKKNHKYFLLKDEVESMVEGMYARSKQLDVPLDDVFIDYLQPFMITKYISEPEYSEVLSTWVKYALQRYPDAVFSKKVEKIVNSI